MSGGNTFHGTIAEFPEISVDKFSVDASAFLLTHCHADHLAGLDAKSFAKKVYCSKITKTLVSLNEKYRHILPFLTVLEEGKHSISVRDRTIDLTLIVSYHCPGSSMFLLEDGLQSVLITGDIRAERWWVDGLPKNPFLFPYTTGLKTLSNIYFDSSFSYRGEPYIELPSNNDGVQAAIQLLLAYPRDDEEIQFYFLDTTSGFEEPWAQITSVFDGSLTLGQEMKKRIDALEKQNYATASLLRKKTQKSHLPKFHVLESSVSEVPTFTVTIKQCVDFNLVDMAGILLPIPISSITSEESKSLKLLKSTAKGNEIYNFRNRKWLLPKGGTELLPKEVKLVFSRHSTYSETRHLIELFHPLQVYPICETKTSWLQGFSMARTFGDLCGSREFLYDLSMFKKFGQPELSVQERPVVTINRWTFEGCQSEQSIVEKYLQSEGTKDEFLKKYLQDLSSEPKKSQFNFKGIGYFGSKYEKNFDADGHIGRAKDFKLQNLISGRNESVYKNKINECQQLYSGNTFQEVRGLLSAYDREQVDGDQDSYYSDSLRSSTLLKSSPTNSFDGIKQEPEIKREKTMNIKKEWPSQEELIQVKIEPVDSEVIKSERKESQQKANTKISRSRPRLKRKEPSSPSNSACSRLSSGRLSFDSQGMIRSGYVGPGSTHIRKSFILQTTASHQKCPSSKKISSISQVLKRDSTSWFSLNLSSVKSGHFP